MTVLKFSRSGQDSFRRCPRAHFYGYLYGGSGLEPSEPIHALTFGLSLHKGMEVLFKKGSNVDAAMDAAVGEWRKLLEGRPQIRGIGPVGYPDFLEEQEALLMAFIMAWRVQFWESFNNEFEIVQIEKELSTKVSEAVFYLIDDGATPAMDPEVVLQSRCDLVVRERETGAIYIPDWKGVKDARDWGIKFSMESQTWAQMHAVSEHLGEKVAGCIYWAFIKGDRKGGRQLSYLIYGYKKPLKMTEGWEYSEEYENSKGWERFPVWKEEAFGPTVKDRLRYWVNWISEETRAAQFCQSPPVLRNDMKIQRWLNQSVRNELAKHAALAAGDMDFFQANESSWNCKGCSFKRVCDEDSTPEEELALGNFKLRVDHHLEEGGAE